MKRFFFSALNQIWGFSETFSTVPSLCSILNVHIWNTTTTVDIREKKMNTFLWLLQHCYDARINPNKIIQNYTYTLNFRATINPTNWIISKFCWQFAPKHVASSKTGSMTEDRLSHCYRFITAKFKCVQDNRVGFRFIGLAV